MALHPPRAAESSRPAGPVLPKERLYDWDRSPADLEAAVLGHIMARPDAEAGEIIERLNDEAFSHPHLRATFRAARTLQADGLPFGPVEITDRMRAEGTLTDDDPRYLVELAGSTFAPSLLPSLVERLRGNARCHLAQDLAKVLHDIAESPRPDFGGLAALLRTVANDLDDGRPEAGLHDLRTYGGRRRASRR